MKKIRNIALPYLPTLGEFIHWLEEQDPSLLIPLEAEVHSDRGDYEQVAIPPGSSKAGDLRSYLQGRLGDTMYGWKGGDFTISAWCHVFVAHFGDMGPRLGILDNEVVTVGDGWDVR